MEAKEVNNHLVEEGLTLGSVESFTGGLFASRITTVPGASKLFKGAYVTYATEEKIRLLSIPQAVMGSLAKKLLTTWLIMEDNC